VPWAALVLLVAAAWGRAERFPRPGLHLNTSVRRENIDHAVFTEWVAGKEKAPDGRGADRGPEWVLWTCSNEHPGHNGLILGTEVDAKVPFSSPWRTILFDEVKDVSAEVKLSDSREGHYELSVPLAVLGLRPDPGMSIPGDIGILRGNGTETTVRSYWSNKATAITADVPSEAMLTPHLWGTIEWE